LYDGGAVTDSTREGVGNNVVLSRNVFDVCRELGNKVKVVELPWWAFVPLLLEGVGDGLLVEDGEMARFQHMAEMLYGFVYGQQLAVVGAVLLLGRVEFFR
jgi:hypothetical protein